MFSYWLMLIMASVNIPALIWPFFEDRCLLKPPDRNWNFLQKVTASQVFYFLWGCWALCFHCRNLFLHTHNKNTLNILCRGDACGLSSLTLRELEWIPSRFCSSAVSGVKWAPDCFKTETWTQKTRGCKFVPWRPGLSAAGWTESGLWCPEVWHWGFLTQAGGSPLYPCHSLLWCAPGRSGTSLLPCLQWRWTRTTEKHWYTQYLETISDSISLIKKPGQGSVSNITESESFNCGYLWPVWRWWDWACQRGQIGPAHWPATQGHIECPPCGPPETGTAWSLQQTHDTGFYSGWMLHMCKGS